jgi:hypothetical protein
VSDALDDESLRLIKCTPFARIRVGGPADLNAKEAVNIVKVREKMVAAVAV